jgi:hypothetical protein
MMKKLISRFETFGFGLLLIAAGLEISLAEEIRPILHQDSHLNGSVTSLLAYSDQLNEDSTKKNFCEDFIREDIQDVKKAKKFCFLAKPKPECGSFLITEFGYAFRFDHSSNNRQYLTWELGWMKNKNKSSAVGGTVFFGLDQDFEESNFAFKPRFRWWLNKTESLDLAAGILIPGGKNNSFISPSYTGHVGFNVGNSFALVGQVEIIRQVKNGTDVAWYGGFKLGTPFGAISGTAVAVAIGLLSLVSSFPSGPIL